MSDRQPSLADKIWVGCAFAAAIVLGWSFSASIIASLTAVVKVLANN